MSEKNNWLKSIIVFGSVLLVIFGMMPREAGTEYVASNNIWSQGQAIFGEDFWLLSELTLGETDEEEYDEPTVTEPENEAEPDEIVEPEPEPEPQLPPYTVTEMTAVMYAQTNCNVRSGPSTDYDIIGGLTLNQLANIVGVADTGWYKIDYSGMDAFVSNTLLAETQVVIPEPEPEPAPTPETPADTQPKQRWEYSEEEIKNALYLHTAEELEYVISQGYGAGDLIMYDISEETALYLLSISQEYFLMMEKMIGWSEKVMSDPDYQQYFVTY